MVVSVLGGFRALEWALQKVVWQIERNFQQFFKNVVASDFGGLRRGKYILSKSIEIYKTNKIMKKYPTIFLKMWSCQFWVVVVR